jgi:hypothetical protein
VPAGGWSRLPNAGSPHERVFIPVKLSLLSLKENSGTAKGSISYNDQLKFESK